MARNGGRPGRDRERAHLFIDRTTLAALDRLAGEHGRTRSDAIRAAVAVGLRDQAAVRDVLETDRPNPSTNVRR